MLSVIQSLNVVFLSFVVYTKAQLFNFIQKAEKKNENKSSLFGNLGMKPTKQSVINSTSVPLSPVVSHHSSSIFDLSGSAKTAEKSPSSVSIPNRDKQHDLFHDNQYGSYHSNTTAKVHSEPKEALLIPSSQPKPHNTTSNQNSTTVKYVIPGAGTGTGTDAHISARVARQKRESVQSQGMSQALSDVSKVEEDETRQMKQEIARMNKKFDVIKEKTYKIDQLIKDNKYVHKASLRDSKRLEREIQKFQALDMDITALSQSLSKVELNLELLSIDRRLKQFDSLKTAEVEDQISTNNLNVPSLVAELMKLGNTKISGSYIDLPDGFSIVKGDTVTIALTYRSTLLMKSLSSTITSRQ